MTVPAPPQIILASGSQIRKQILTDAGLEFKVQIMDVDEDAIKQQALVGGRSPREIAVLLATAKAQSIEPTSGKLIIGADQLMEMNGQIFDKPKTMTEAKKRLQNMRGKEHCLIGAVVVCESGEKPWVHISTTKLFMRNFSDSFLDGYLKLEGEDILKSVGAYMFERRGAQLFEWVEGDFFSILGLPLLPLLQYLRSRGGVQV